MSDHTVSLTDTEELAMNYVSTDVDFWINNFAKERARIAIDEIVQLAIKQYLATGQQIPNTQEAIVQGAFDNGWVQTAQQRHDEVMLTSIARQNQP